MGPALQVFGTDYDTPDGTAIRDYIHVEDLASAHVRALEHLRSGGASDAFNLGSGKGTSVRETLDGIARITGCEVPWNAAPRRAGDPPVLVADAAKAARVLGWRAKRSDITTVLESAHAWHGKTIKR